MSAVASPGEWVWWCADCNDGEDRLEWPDVARRLADEHNRANHADDEDQTTNEGTRDD